MTSIAKDPATGITARAAGYTHAAAWILGLAAAWGATPEVGDTHAEITTAYADRPFQAVAQALLVHGVAAVCLVVVGSGLLDWARRTNNSAGRLAGWAGRVTGALACVQLVLELIAIPGADPTSPGRTGALFEAVQRADGVKMFALAALAATACVASRHGTLLRRWEVVIGWALAATIAASGIGYLLLSTTLTPAAFISLPLLLIWIAVLGAALRRRP
ncbi:hypothetical protein OG508_02305 [Streptomyces sp. NBC_01108]|uniref:hypothetical protein n=1 Tax=unclassified Streptomyces TaxID=2593676 RepID=UPI00352C8831|nr:hypothetical protein OG306_38075 [Streptomyces sp. NBC_01241]WSU19946.1 hypothetical protein OG508_02305 [Streptomyces sp. NBC_01108]